MKSDSHLQQKNPVFSPLEGETLLPDKPIFRRDQLDPMNDQDYRWVDLRSISRIILLRGFARGA